MDKINVKEKLINFWNKNKTKIIAGAMFAGGLIIGYAIKKNDEVSTIDTDSDNNVLRKFVDEDIFTRIAPFIEESVLDEGVDEDYLEMTYEVDHPKFGDPKNGYYIEKKKVEVKVSDVTEP